MGKRKWMGIYIAVLAALLVGPSLSVAAGPELINNSFVLGDSGCQMNIALDGGTGAIVSADLGPAFEPPPMEYSFNFTGTVQSVSGSQPPPAGIGAGTSFSGTLTYAPSTFAFGTTNPDSQLYVPAGSSTIATLSVTYYGADNFTEIQSFQTSAFGYSSVINNTGIAPGIDMYDFYSASMSSNPSLDVVARSVFFLRDDAGAALTGLAYPTNLNLADWNSTKTLQVYVPIDGESFIWTINGTLTSLARVPSPPSGIGINSVASLTALESTAVTGCVELLHVGSISDTLICKECSDNGDGTFDCSGAGAGCEPKTAVERNIMEKSGDGSTYCYYDKTGQRVCKTI